MSQEPASIARSGRRIAGYLAASVALLLGSWALLRARTGPPEDPPPVAVAQPAVAEPAAAALPAENLDTPRRIFREFDEDQLRAAAEAEAIPPDRIEARIQAMRDKPPPPPPDPVVMAAAAAELAAYPAAMDATAEAIEQRRAALRRACAPRGGSPVTLFITTRFGADGKLQEHTVTDDGSAPDVAECVHQQIASLKIDPPGVALLTRAKIELP